MSNVLFIGPYREFNGRGQAARNYIKTLLAAEHNVSIRPIYNTFQQCSPINIDAQILELENNFSKKYHAVIQHCYPHQYVFDNRFDLNIGLCSFESTNYNTRLKDYFDLMDMIIVPSEFSRSVVIQSGTTSKVSKILTPINLEEFDEYKNNNAIEESSDKFTFYTICDITNKNNISKIITAFFLTFDNIDNVELIIKTKNHIHKKYSSKQILDYELSKIDGIIHKNHESPKIIFGELQKEAIMYIHNNGCCHIDVSSGQGFGNSILEAMALDNQILVNNNTLGAEIAEKTNNFIVESTVQNCLDNSKCYSIYNTIFEQWYEPSIESMSEQMLAAYQESHYEKDKRLQKTRDKLEKYDIKTLAKNFDNI